ncbi:hypothetical protein GF356_10240 [candidate division GN15 bacterium]|nr:hypothetical protein [candidate division GN15 bacterium]
MKIGKLLKFGKKGAKAASSQNKDKDSGGYEWPSGIRVGIVGHSNSGKTVYLSVLHDDCKTARDLQLSVSDSLTASSLLASHRKMWGLSPSAGEGTMVDVRQDPEFPELNRSDTVMKMVANLDRSHKVPIVTYDYPGDAVSIGAADETAEKVTDFMVGCDGLLFFFDPKTLGSPTQWQSHVAAFEGMIQRLGPLDERLSIPVGLVITKADVLPGFKGDQHVSLIHPSEEPVLGEDYDEFFEQILANPRIQSDPDWAASVRDVLTKLKGFLKTIVGRTLDFQVFFVSSVGSQPEKIGAELGRSIYKPPDPIRPIGVKRPFYWLLKSITRNRRLEGFRKAKRLVRNVVLAWVVVCSVVFMWHLWWQLGRATGLEQDILAKYDNDAAATTPNERKAISDAYRHYSGRWLVRKVFREFMPPARDLYVTYGNLQAESLTDKLARLHEQMVNVVGDDSQWPRKDPATGELSESDRYHRLRMELKSLTEDSSSAVFSTAARSYRAWEQFTECAGERSNSACWKKLDTIIAFNREVASGDLGQGEANLYAAISQVVSGAEVEENQVVQASDAAQELETLASKINGNPDPSYRLDGAVRELRAILRKLAGAKYTQERAAVERYLSAAERMNRRQRYELRIESIPDNGHLHLEVVRNQQEPEWPAGEMVITGDTKHVSWAPGDDIYIAFDEPHVDLNETWGKDPDDLYIARDKYCLYDLNDDITFPGKGTVVSITLVDNPAENLPILKLGGN